jgi:hypothetical protein
MRKLGEELEFISWIKRDGSGTDAISEDYLKMLQTEEFDVTCLSMSQGTFIASGFNSFVVKLKEKKVLGEINTFNKHRRLDNPQEAKNYEVASKWKKEHGVIFDQAILGADGRGKPKEYLTDREYEIVFSTLQWLGSHVGESFLRECGYNLPKTEQSS